MHYDLIIRHAMVVDGSGSKGYPADIAISGKRIERIGNLASSRAKKTIDANGRVACPGFIDAHSHADLALLVGSSEQEKLRMGVTTEIIGQCGFSAFPVERELRRERKESMAGFLPGVSLDWNWRNLDDYRQRISSVGLNLNAAPLVGHGSVRMAVMGNRSDTPSAIELERMCGHVHTAMQSGAFGLSSGLIYPPACYASTEELEALASTAATYGGCYVTHLRGETAALIDAAIEEALHIAATAKLPLQVSHLKVIGRQPHTSGKITDVLRMLDTARRDGTDVAFDCYPYTWGSTVLSALMPPWAMTEGMAGLRRQLASDKGRFRLRSAIEDDASTWENWVWACGWEAIRIAAVKGGHPSGLLGRSLSEIACDCHRPPFDVLCDILMEEGAGAMMVFEMMRETDMLTALTHPMGMVGTDAIPCPPGQGHPHPRGYGTFAGILGHWVRDRKVLTLEGAVRKMSALPARRFKVAERGLLAEGYYADLVVFNPHTVAATATIEDPRRFPIGIDHVIVNGAVALSNAEPTGELSGQFLVRAGSMIQP